MLTKICIAAIASYVSLTTALADTIEQWLMLDNQPQTIVQQAPTESLGITTLPSTLSRSIPTILLDNPSYQQAALGEAGLTGATVADPRQALVNIFCTLTTEKSIRTTTGTGFFIDPDGVIITNAHVAQFLLLAKTDVLGDTECTIRSGNPATPTYTAELLYLPPAWVQENAGIIYEAVPMGTGERDYALLYVSSRVDAEPLPAVFPALAFDTEPLPITARGMGVTAAGYPATNLLENGPTADLVPQSASSTLSELYTFGSNYADVFSIQGTAVGAEGASGGPILNESGEVIGVIVTRGDDTVDGAGSLRAITMSHIQQTILEETGFSLVANAEGNLPYRAQIFAETLSPFLLTILQQQKK